MTETLKPMNRAALSGPTYAQPVLGNPAATLMESGVGNCFPGLEFDLRQLDVRFFPGLVFEFPGVTPAGPDGTQGARLVYADMTGDPMFDLDADWVTDLKAQFNGAAGAALGDGQWYLHSVEQYGKKIELYDFVLYQNTVTQTPYEGETAWWIIRLIEADPNPDVADLTVGLTQRAPDGSPVGNPVYLKGKRRVYLDGEGMISEVYHPGELTASMCSPWTHDFRDCACQYWASNHPDVVLGPVVDPRDELEDGTSKTDPAQAVTFLDWMRRRKLPGADLSAETTIEGARPRRYDPYEINLHWQELDFVLHGKESNETHNAGYRIHAPGSGYADAAAAITALTNDLAPLEYALAVEYLYAYFSLRSPDEVSVDQEKEFPGLANDLRAARQLILSVALSEMTHMRWANQTLWMLDQAGLYPKGKCYEPVIEPAKKIPDGKTGGTRPRALKVANSDTLQTFVDVERPDGTLDTEYGDLVRLFSDPAGGYPDGLYELAVRIDTDGLQHYQKFRDTRNVLLPYSSRPDLFLRSIKLAKDDDKSVQLALDLLDQAVEALRRGYGAEAAGDMTAAQVGITAGREAMHRLNDACEFLAQQGIGVPFFARFGG